MIQVRVEGKSYLLLPVKPATIIEDETYVAATLASEGPIDSNETYLGLTTADAKEALKMKVDLDEAKQKLALMDQRIASFQEEREQYEAALRLKDEAVGQMELALDQKNQALDLKNETLDQKNQALSEKNETLDLKNKALDQKNDALDLKNEAIEEQLKLRDYYRELADTYRKKADGGKWFSLSAGVGATSNSEPAALVGIGIKRFRVWAFAQESNTGVMGGLELPLF